MSDHILMSYAFDGKGGASALPTNEISAYLEADQIAWIHMDANHPDTQTWLDKEIAYLDPFIAEALLADETSPRMTQIGDGFLLFLRGVNMNENEAPEDMVSIRLWIDNHRIISVRKRKLKAVSDMVERLEAGKGPKDAGDFVSMLVSKMFNRIEPVLTGLQEAIDDVEEAILEEANTSLRQSIVQVRKQAIIFRRYMAPQRDAILQLYSADISWLSSNHRRHLQESLNRVNRYVDDLDAVRERAQIVKDELSTMLSDQMNKNMYVLSIIAAIFLPLGFLTGLLGINVGGIPGAENGDAFWMFVGSCIVLVAVQIVVFKKMRWF